jgi:hypothetical protein
MKKVIYVLRINHGKYILTKGKILFSFSGRSSLVKLLVNSIGMKII